VQLRRIALIVREDSFYIRGLLHGVTLFARPHAPWVFLMARPNPDGLKLARQWRPEGVITNTDTAALESGVLSLRCPSVNVGNVLFHPRIPWVATDDRLVGRMAADYFLDRGFQHFAFYGLNDARFSVERQASFALRLQEWGCELSSLTTAMSKSKPSTGMPARQALHRWLSKLPKPLAIFACNDSTGRELAEACHEQGLAVPEQIALLGADDDKLLCELAWPPLSSITLPVEQIGFQAASLLQTLMQDPRRAEPAHPILLPPRGVTSRQSSDIFAINDPHIAASLQFIRQHLHKPIGVRDILRQVPVARRTLEQQFRAVLRRSPLQEIRRARLERVQTLLTDTELSMSAIAQRCGFHSPERMSAVFHQELGTSPRAYRRKFRIR
jgi:LacI family transcriptional regulator